MPSAPSVYKIDYNSTINAERISSIQLVPLFILRKIELTTNGQKTDKGGAEMTRGMVKK